MNRVIKVFLLVTVLIPSTMVGLNAESFDPHRDYFEYHKGHGNVTIKFEHLQKCHQIDLLDNVSLYQIQGEGADVHYAENDDVYIPAQRISHNSITWDVDETGYYYINLVDDQGRSTAFGEDLISCYLWFNRCEDAVMHLDVRELAL